MLFCDEALYSRMSAACRKIYKEKFTADVYAKAIEGVYTAVLAKKK